MSGLPPRAKTALIGVVRQAFEAGIVQQRGGRALNLQQMQDYAFHQVEQAVILDAAEAEARELASVQDPH